MPSVYPQPILPPSIIAVTGANGFIAQHCIALLLSEGYRVIGTVRSQAKAEQVFNVHGRNPNLSVRVVEDITSVESYVSAFGSTQLDAILHLAAPFHYDTTDLERDLMIPTIRGSTAILNAARLQGGVKRIVHTNSFAGIYDASKGLQPGKIYTAKDWSPLTYEDGVTAPAAAIAYRASKTVAEKVAWKWMDDNPSARFDLVSLNPAMVFGPFLQGAVPESPEQLNTSNQIVYGIVSGGKNGSIPPTRGPVWVSVGDVALAHLKAIQVPEAGGERYLLAAGVYCNQEIADTAREIAGKNKIKIPIGNPGLREAATHFDVDASETEKALGIKWQSLEDTLSEMLPQLYEIGNKVQ